MTTTRFDQPDNTWMSFGNCQGVPPDLMFPVRGASTREAKAVCAECTVRDECLDHALRAPELFGIWGGTSERERRRLRARLPKICLQCGREFSPQDRHEQICSDACRAARERDRAATYRRQAS